MELMVFFLYHIHFNMEYMYEYIVTIFENKFRNIIIKISDAIICTVYLFSHKQKHESLNKI